MVQDIWTFKLPISVKMAILLEKSFGKKIHLSNALLDHHHFLVNLKASLHILCAHLLLNWPKLLLSYLKFFWLPNLVKNQTTKCHACSDTSSSIWGLSCAEIQNYYDIQCLFSYFIAFSMNIKFSVNYCQMITELVIFKL